MATTEQQLKEQYELTQKELGLSQSQLEQSYKLAQSQLQAQELEQQDSARRLAQQAYVQKSQSERVAPNVLSAMGVADTGYENIYKGRLESTYKGKYGDIQYNLGSALSDINRTRATQALSFEQSQQQLALQRESAALDYRQALERLREQAAASSSSANYPSGFTASQKNGNLISNQLVEKLKNNEITTLQAAQTVKNKYEEGYLDYQDYINATNKVMRVKDSVVALNIPSKLTTNQTSKLNKALAVGGR